MKILFRVDQDNKEEYDVCKKIIETYNFRTNIPQNSTVIGRYSVLPYYKELEDELKLSGSKLINSFEQHCFIADVMQWANTVLDGLTPKTYTRWDNIPEGSYVLKGKTNSRKHQWATHMFAQTKADIPRIAKNLLGDQLLSDQGIVCREYHKLKQFSTGINELPITNEWRFFILNGEIVTCGYYWACDEDAIEIAGNFPNDAAYDLVYEAIDRIGTLANFYVLDVAQCDSGEWIVIEINDGQMSGLSTIDPEKFYQRLYMM